MSDTLTHLALDELEAHPNNVRSSLGDLRALTKSIAAQGVLEPLIVRPVDDDGNLTEHDEHIRVFQIVAGHRRHAAALEALPAEATLPCIVRQLDDDDTVTHMLVENLQREDIDPLDEARGYFRLIERGWTQKRLADEVGVSGRTVRERLRLLDLPQQWVKAHLAGELSQEALGKLDALRDDPFWTDDLADYTALSTIGRELESRRIAAEKEALAAEIEADGEAVLVVKEPDGRGYGMKLPNGMRYLPHEHASSHSHDPLPVDIDDVVAKGLLGYSLETTSVTTDEGRRKIAYAHPVCTKAAVFTRKSSSIDPDKRPAGWEKDQERKAKARAEREAKKAAKAQLVDRTAEAMKYATKTELEDVLLPRVVNGLSVTESKAAAEALGVAQYRDEDARYEPGKYDSLATEKAVLESSRVKQLRFVVAAKILGEGIHCKDDVTALLDEHAPLADAPDEEE